MKPIKITTEYITLGQFLKWNNLASSGGEIKMILQTVQIKVNGVLENRRGKKLYPKDEIAIEDIGVFVIVKNDS
jgi:S4 domain protein YaaA